MKGFASTAKRQFQVRASTICRTWPSLPYCLLGTSSAQSVPYQRTFPQSKAIVEKRLQGVAIVQRWPSPDSGRLHRSRRSSLGSLPPRLLSMHCSGERYPIRWIHGASQRNHFRLVHGPSFRKVRLSGSSFQWPAGSRFPRSLAGSLGRSRVVLQPNAWGERLDPRRPRPEPVQSAWSRSSRTAATAAPGARIQNASRFAIQAWEARLSLDHMSSLATQKAVIDRHAEEQAKEVKGLEEILRNQAHPANLVAVKKKDTPVLANPIENAKVLFLASAEDEFEILDANPNWVHVRISGISRGWIRRSSLEMPTADPDPPPAPTEAQSEPLRMPTPSHFTWRMKRSHPFPGIGNRSREKR